MKQLNLHHLMYFREIALAGSVSKAANKLNIGQPTLSEQLRLLELSLGHKLFERNKRKMQLTEVGKSVLKCANDIAKTSTVLLDNLEHHYLGQRAMLNIGVVNSVPKHLVLKLIRDAQSLHPCRTSIVEGGADELLRELHAGQIDILISVSPATTNANSELFSRSLAKSAISIYGAQQYANLQASFPQSLDGQLFILPNRESRLRHDIEHYLKINDIRVEVFAETHDTSIQKLLGIEGYGLLALPEFSTLDLVKEGHLVKLGMLAGVYEEFWLITSKHIIDNPTALKLANEFDFTL